VSFYCNLLSLCRECTKLPYKKSFHSPQSVFLCWSYTYDGASSQWCANPWKRRLPKFNGVSMTVQVVKKWRDRKAVWWVGRFAWERKRGIEESSTSSTKQMPRTRLKMPINWIERSTTYSGTKDRVVVLVVHRLAYRSLSSIYYYLLDDVIKSALFPLFVINVHCRMHFKPTNLDRHIWCYGIASTIFSYLFLLWRMTQTNILP